MRMNAADTSASSATVACTPVAVVSRSRTTAEIDTFIREVHEHEHRHRQQHIEARRSSHRRRRHAAEYHRRNGATI